MKIIALAASAFLIAAIADRPAFAQEKRSITARVGLGAQLTPRYPGADKVQIGPFVDVSIKRGDENFGFEAPDESFGISIVSTNGFAIGPVASIENSRRERDVGAAVGRVPTTFEAGGFVQYQLSPSFRLRSEVRKGIGGHEGVVGTVSADYVIRDEDNYLFSIGPRVTLGNARYQRAYFGVSPQVAAATGLAQFRPDGGVHAVGATAGFLYQFGPRWGINSYARYDRLIGDADRSPIVRRFGSSNQFSGGLALTYTFAVRR
jgi:outer membrane protein